MEPTGENPTPAPVTSAEVLKRPPDKTTSSDYLAGVIIRRSSAKAARAQETNAPQLTPVDKAANGLDFFSHLKPGDHFDPAMGFDRTIDGHEVTFHLTGVEMGADGRMVLNTQEGERINQDNLVAEARTDLAKKLETADPGDPQAKFLKAYLEAKADPTKQVDVAVMAETAHNLGLLTNEDALFLVRDRYNLSDNDMAYLRGETNIKKPDGSSYSPDPNVSLLKTKFGRLSAVLTPEQATGFCEQMNISFDIKDHYQKVENGQADPNLIRALQNTDYEQIAWLMMTKEQRDSANAIALRDRTVAEAKKRTSIMGIGGLGILLVILELLKKRGQQ